MKIKRYASLAIQRLIFELSRLVLGNHPNNTIFSFNYHNVSHINSFLRKAKLCLGDQSAVLVDIGSGKSPYYPIFSDTIDKYIAVDTPESLPQQETRPLQQIPGFAEALPVADEFADVVLCNQVLEHVQDPARATNEMYRVLKSGGYCIGSVPHVSPVHLEPYDFRRYTDLGLKQLLENAGFTDINVETSGGVYSAAALMIAMDWMLTTRQTDRPQGFSASRALFLSPLVAVMNVLGILFDAILGNKHRTPANLCWTAQKPDHSINESKSF